MVPNYFQKKLQAYNFHNSYKTDQVKKFLKTAIEKEIAITVEIGLKYDNKDLDFEPEEDFEGYLETE